jgi:hypothetical protein
MKKYFFLLLSLVFMLGCSKGGDDKEEVVAPFLNGVPTTSLLFAHDGDSELLSIESNRPWSITVAGGAVGWLSVSTSSGGIGTTEVTVTAQGNNSVDRRSGEVTFSASSMQPKKFTVTQSGVPAESTSYADGEVLQLQEATMFGTNDMGINIVVMGDGYTIDDMDKDTGKYEKDMREAMNSFFSVYPLSEYRDYFNVYMVVAI